MDLTSKAATIGSLFHEKPTRWGLRGDAFLWDEMARELNVVACPSAPAGVRSLVEEIFARLTGLPMCHPDSILVERYSHGGMSSGHVCPEFWRDKVLPMLLERYAASSFGDSTTTETVSYRITKDCGIGWSESLEPAVSAWGVSETQRGRAEKVAIGDVLLHYIDHAHAWAGYSAVSGTIQKNHRDAHADWLAALPYVIPIERRVWLKEGQCERTVSVVGLANKHYERQVAFTLIPPAEAKSIIDAINVAAAMEATASTGFHDRWMTGAEAYYKGIVKDLADGKCWLCGENADSWTARSGIEISKDESESIHRCFLDAAHIIAHCDLGQMTPDNLRPLCPNCHRIVDRLSDERREKLLREKR